MPYDKIVVPQDGDKITVENNSLNVPDHPILAYIEGDDLLPRLGELLPQFPCLEKRHYDCQQANLGCCGSGGLRWPTESCLDGNLRR